MQESRWLIIFVKAPRPGWVKTRLAESLGPDAACDAYKRMVKRLLREVEALPNVQLRFSPDDAESELGRWLRPGWTILPQGGGDLGARLSRTFAGSFAAGAARVAIIGSDCPFISVDDIEQAWSALNDHDVVLGPAHDGGYWLVALRAPAPVIFEDIPWSTGRVLNVTLSRARESGLRVHLLRELRDVDTVEDLRFFVERE